MKTAEKMQARIDELTKANETELQQLAEKKDNLIREIGELKDKVATATAEGRLDDFKKAKGAVQDREFTLQYVKSRMAKLQDEPLISRKEFETLAGEVKEEFAALVFQDEAAFTSLADQIEEIYKAWSERLETVNRIFPVWQRKIFKETPGFKKETSATGQDILNNVPELKITDFGIANFYRTVFSFSKLKDWREKYAQMEEHPKA